MKNSHISPLSLLAGSAATIGLFLLTGMQGTGESFIHGDVREFLSHVSMVDLPDGQGGFNRTVRISGINVQVVSGTGATDGAVNGVGNLIVGYNEMGNDDYDDRTGSHNLVAGSENAYTSYGGLVVGLDNSISGSYASVSGGRTNSASGDFSSVSGGSLGIASGGSASIGGGRANDATGEASSVTGGLVCRATGDFSTAGGGLFNRANGSFSSVSGGEDNVAGGYHSAVCGGRKHTAPGDDDWVAGSLFEDN